MDPVRSITGVRRAAATPRRRRRAVALLLAAALCAPAAAVPPAPPAATAPTASVPKIPRAVTPADVLRLGRPSVHLRLRFEHADDEARPEGADVLSLRGALGFRTASYAGLFALAEVELVGALGSYDDGGANRGMAPRHAQVVDPEGAELNQAYVGLDGLPATVIQLGRQLVLDRDAPYHRHLGNVLWRQNWQTHDAVGVLTDALPATVLRFWYTWNVNRIFGEDHPLRGFDDQGLNGYLFNAVHDGLALGQVEAYAYLLDFEPSRIAAIRSFYPSTQTYGARLSGRRALGPRADLLYHAELAHQSDFAGKPTDDIDQFFAWGMLGGTYRPGGVLEAVTGKLSHEYLGGDGGADRFTTPLATGHAFQGWADRFLNTPGDGVNDTYLTLQASVAGFGLTLDYHWFASDRDGYDYGEELDLQLTQSCGPRCTAGLKYAGYRADDGALNRLRNTAGGQASDLTKLWVWIEYRY